MTLHDDVEPARLPPQAESGWIRMRGVNACNPSNPSFVFDNPSTRPVLFEGIGSWAFGADFPFQIEDATAFNNALLWSTRPDGL